MSPNFLNGSFNAQQVKAIEKYVAAFVADVLKSYEAGPIEGKPGKAQVEAKPAKVAKVVDVMIEGDGK
jgi:hypothetical protein